MTQPITLPATTSTLKSPNTTLVATTSTLVATTSTLVATTSTLSPPPYGGISLDLHLEPETLEEAKQASKKLKAARQARGEFAEYNLIKERLLAEMTDLMTKLIATPADSPQRPEIRAAYMQSKDDYYAHKNRTT